MLARIGIVIALAFCATSVAGAADHILPSKPRLRVAPTSSMGWSTTATYLNGAQRNGMRTSGMSNYRHWWW